MRSKTFDKLSDYDKRLADCPGIVYKFNDVESWESFWKTCHPKALTSRGKLVVIVAKED
jgi:hypothetical protein